MQKLNDLKDNLLELSFLALLIKTILFGAGIGEALAIISLVISMTYNKFLNKSKMDQYQEIISRINSDKELLLKEIELLNNKVTGLTLDKSIKRTSLNEQEISRNPGAIKRLF